MALHLGERSRSALFDMEALIQAAPPAPPVPACCLGTARTPRPNLAALPLTVSAFAIACQEHVAAPTWGCRFSASKQHPAEPACVTDLHCLRRASGDGGAEPLRRPAATYRRCGGGVCVTG